MVTLLMIVKRFDSLFINSSVKKHCHGKAEHLSNGECPPDKIHIACQTQQICRRQQYEQLSGKALNGGINTVAQRLEGRRQGNTDGSQGEAEADGTQGANSHIHKGGM